MTQRNAKDLRDRAAECLRVSVAFGERLIEPGPADLRQDGVGGDFKIDVGIDVRDDSSGAFPGGLPAGSCNTTRRPEPTRSSPISTSTVCA